MTDDDCYYLHRTREKKFLTFFSVYHSELKMKKKSVIKYSGLFCKIKQLGLVLGRT